MNLRILLGVTLFFWMQGVQALEKDEIATLKDLVETACSQGKSIEAEFSGEAGIMSFLRSIKGSGSISQEKQESIIDDLESDESKESVTSEMRECRMAYVNQIFEKILDPAPATNSPLLPPVPADKKFTQEACVGLTKFTEESFRDGRARALDQAYGKVRQTILSSGYEIDRDFTLVGVEDPHYFVSDSHEECVRVTVKPSFEPKEDGKAFLPGKSIKAESYGSTLRSIIGRDLVNVSVYKDFPPFAFEDDKLDGIGCEAENYVGIDIDIACELSRRWLRDKEKVRILPVTLECRIPSVIGCEESCQRICDDEACIEECGRDCDLHCGRNQGGADLTISSLTDSYPRRRQIDYSAHYFEDGQRIIVRGKDNIDSVCDVVGKIAVTSGSTAKHNIKQAIEKCKSSKATIDDQYVGNSDAIDSLLNGNAQAFATDSSALIWFQGKYGDRLKVVGGHVSKEMYGIGVSKDDGDLKQLVDLTLEEMHEDGTLGDIFCRWLKQGSYPVDVLTQNPDANLLEMARSERSPLFDHMNECEKKCGSYTIVRNDSLSYISQKSYGSLDSWKKIYDRNVDIIGSDPDRIEVGRIIDIPCLK